MGETREIRAVSGTNLGGANLHNRRVIVDALRVNGPLSRAELARATQLTKQTVSNLVDDLQRRGLVRPLDAVRSARGKPATPYTLVPDGAFSFGLQIDRHVFRTVAVNLVGEVLLQREVEPACTGPEAGVAAILDLIGAAQDELMARRPKAADRLVGLGVAMPGPFGRETEDGDPLFSMLAWQRYPLLERLTEATGLEVALQNDASAAATAERLIGAAHGLDNAVCIYLGYGLGAGLILNGEVFGGQTGNAGEIGMALAPPGGRGAGTPEPLEHTASLASLCAAMGFDPADPALFARIDRAIADGNTALLAWAEVAADRLRWMVHLLETVFDPQTVVLCGGAPRSLIDLLVARMEPLLASLADRVARSHPRIQPGRADPWAVAVGAAAEPIARFFNPSYSALLKA